MCGMFGNALNAFINNSDVLLHFPDEPTHTPANGTTPSVVDLVLAKNVRDVGDITVRVMSSDHVALEFQLGEGPVKTAKRRVMDYSRANWMLFRQMLNQRAVNNRLESAEDLESAVTTLTEDIVRAAKRSIPLKIVDPYKFSEMPADIRVQIAERNKKRRMYQRTRDPNHLAEMKSLSAEIKSKVAQHRNEVYASRLGEINVRDGSIWRLNKHLRRPHEGVNAVQRPDGTYVIQREEVAEMMADTFRRYHEMPMPPSDDETYNMVQSTVSGFLLQNPIHPINALGLLTTPKRVREIISRTPSTKAPGPDNIQNLLLKNVPRKTLVQLTVIINGIL
ncbi:hypothetical protein QE152_g27391 [Popillia japonica]|uniref:Uncharacterized protein n=1 Tax=Popillia japonica TaxID=7064 RepID=A0AAW1JWD0_POPJA